MFLSLETAMSSSVLLSVIFFQGVWGTFFPPVENPPPIPGPAVRTVDTSLQQFYVQEDLPQPIVKEGLFPSDAKPDEQRWYIQENQSGDSSDFQSSIETFDRFYPNGEPAIGPVATPMPDDAYVAQPSSISKINPPDGSGVSDIWVLTGGSDNPERWVQIQIPSERFVQVVNQDSGPALATNAVKSVAAPVPLELPAKGQIIPNAPPSIVQQVWVKGPDIAGPQKSFPNTAAVVAEVPSVKQVVEVQPASIKQVVQTQFTKDALAVPPPLMLPKSATISKTQFTAPPPPPPPLKGGDVSPKIISPVPVNVVSDPNILVTNKNGLTQQVRHIWIPTSARTGKFISVPISPAVDSKISIPSKGIPLDPTPVAISDTWVLKQDGPLPSFEQQKSVFPPPVVQSGKVVIQDPPIFQVNAIPAPAVVAQVDSPKNAPVISKSINANVPLDIWPPRKDITNSKVLDKSAVVFSSELSPPPKTETIVQSKSFPVPPPAAQQKTLVASPKGGPFPPPQLPPPPAVQIVNGKPCPIPPPLPLKSLFPSGNPQSIAVPRILASPRKQPLTRIIRVNRYPTGSYYLLNSKIRPSIFTYPSSAFIQQSKPRLVRLVQAKQIPIQIQSKPVIPVQTKQISIPVQAKVPAPIPTRQVRFPFTARQLIVPVSTVKTQSRIIYPGVQGIRYAYPWNAFLKPAPVPGKRVLSPLSSPLKKVSSKKKSKPASSSSESSSSESSVESSKEEKKAEKKEEKKAEKKEEKEKEEEKSGSEEKETEMETEEEAQSAESEPEESKSETESNENLEVAESQLTLARENIAAIASEEHTVRAESKPYMFGFDHRDRNGTIQHRHEVSNADGRVTGSYGYHDPEGIYRLAKYVADSEGFRVKMESNEPGTVTHESANANFITNLEAATEEKSIYQAGESTDVSITTDFQRD